MAVVKATLHKFLKHVDAKYDEALDLHVIIDNYATQTRPVVKRRPKRHPRFTLHFTPTSSSWLNLVERWFRELTHKSIRRGEQHLPREQGYEAARRAWNLAVDQRPAASAKRRKPCSDGTT